MQLLRQILRSYRQSFTGLSRETWLLASVILINRCGFMAVPFMSLYLTQHLHRPATDAGLVITLFGVGSIAGAAVGGMLTDRIGYRPVQVGALLLGGALFLLFGAVTHFPTLCALSLVIPFFTEAFRPANFAATHAYAKPGTNTRSYALNRLAMNIGWAVGSAMGGLLAAHDYRAIFWVDGSISILAGITLWILLPPLRSAMGKARTAVRKGTQLWHDSLFLRFMAVTTLFATCFFLMFRIGPLFFKEQWHLRETTIGLVLGFNGIIIALFEMVLITRIEKRRTPLHFAVLGAFFLAASYLFLLLPAGWALLNALASMLFFTIGEMFALPFINSFVNSRSHEGNRGQYAAGYTLCWSFAQVVGPAGGFFLAEHWGYPLLWSALTALLLIAAWGYALLSRRIYSENEARSLAELTG
ncbi:MAG: MFS transporter [Chitinophagaceae bacterium]|nr:MAG: MFS transporter [Chitinophagaceae bacterium]